MSALSHRPGPDADRAFTVGLVAATVGATAALFALAWVGALEVYVAVLAAVLGLPVYVVYVSCLLAVWLGYDRRV